MPTIEEGLEAYAEDKEEERRLAQEEREAYMEEMRLIWESIEESDVGYWEEWEERHRA